MAESINCAAKNIRNFAYRDFYVEKQLGEGSFNQVYLAAHKDLGRCVLRIVSRNFHVKPKIKQKLEREACSMLSLRHDYIITGYGFVVEPEHLGLVHKFAEHGGLRDALRRINIGTSLKIRIAYQISLAMEHLHNIPGKQILHCNLKASNVLLTSDFTVKVGGFLFTKTVWMATATQEKCQNDRRKELGKSLEDNGTQLAHTPPESLQNMNTKPHRSSDVYAYGVILWELLTNKIPFEGLTNSEVVQKLSGGYTFPYNAIPPNIPSVVSEVMDKSLRRTPEERPSFCEISGKLQPIHEASADKAKADATVCQRVYEQYRVKVRDQKRVMEAASRKGAKNSSQVIQEKRRSYSEPAESSKDAANPFMFPMNANNQASPFQANDSVSGESNTNIYIQAHKLNFQMTQHTQNNEASSSTSFLPSLPPPSPDWSSRIPALNSNRAISSDDNNALFLHIGKNWKQLAMTMDFFIGEIDAIDHDYHTLREKIMHTVRMWSNRRVDVNVGMLAEVLIKAGFSSVAAKLKP